ncbi:MAG TPA: hypothetical protein VIR79_04970 [Nitrospira sp.]
MGQVFRSGAFLQQCWSVHPLCIGVKRIVQGRTLILSCTSCRFVHHLDLSSVAVRVSAVLDQPEESGSQVSGQEGGQAQLESCLAAHAPALSLREMDVFDDVALVRCAECRRHYALTVESFETHQK